MNLSMWKLLSIGVILALHTGCSHPANSSPANDNNTNLVDEVPSAGRHFLKTNSASRNYFESFTSEIRRNQRVSEAIKKAVATNTTNPKVLAFQEFLSHWQLDWPVVKKGAVGEGGLGFSWNPQRQRFEGGADATAIIADRYTLQAILDCNVAENYNDVGFTDIRFVLGEIENVQVYPGGGADIRYNLNNGRQFGLTQWQLLKSSNWDFSKIGINIISNSPIPNIHEAFN